MTEKQFSMTSTQIAKVVGTVASPLVAFGAYKKCS